MRTDELNAAVLQRGKCDHLDNLVNFFLFSRNLKHSARIFKRKHKAAYGYYDKVISSCEGKYDLELLECRLLADATAVMLHIERAKLAIMLEDREGLKAEKEWLRIERGLWEGKIIEHAKDVGIDI